MVISNNDITHQHLHQHSHDHHHHHLPYHNPSRWETLRAMPVASEQKWTVVVDGSTVFLIANNNDNDNGTSSIGIEDNCNNNRNSNSNISSNNDSSRNNNSNSNISSSSNSNISDSLELEYVTDTHSISNESWTRANLQSLIAEEDLVPQMDEDILNYLNPNLPTTTMSLEDDMEQIEEMLKLSNLVFEDMRNEHGEEHLSTVMAPENAVTTKKAYQEEEENKILVMISEAEMENEMGPGFMSARFMEMNQDFLLDSPSGFDASMSMSSSVGAGLCLLSDSDPVLTATSPHICSTTSTSVSPCHVSTSLVQLPNSVSLNHTTCSHQFSNSITTDSSPFLSESSSPSFTTLQPAIAVSQLSEMVLPIASPTASSSLQTNLSDQCQPRSSSSFSDDLMSNSFQVSSTPITTASICDDVLSNSVHVSSSIDTSKTPSSLSYDVSQSSHHIRSSTETPQTPSSISDDVSCSASDVSTPGLSGVTSGTKFLFPLPGDAKMAAATLEALETCCLTPLIKEELKYTIQSRRMAAGKPEIVVDTGRPARQRRVLTAEEKERNKTRREQNRVAAQRFRQKQKDTEDSLSKKCHKLERCNKSLQTEIARLVLEVKELQHMMDSHLPACHRHDHNTP